MPILTATVPGIVASPLSPLLQYGIEHLHYVGGNPLSYIDPFGLIEWTGEFEIGALSGGVGVARVVFNFESECVAGRKVIVDNWVFWAFQADIGLPFAYSGQVCR